MDTGFDSGASESWRSSKSDQAHVLLLCLLFFFFLLLNATHIKSPTPIDPSLHSPLSSFPPLLFCFSYFFQHPFFHCFVVVLFLLKLRRRSCLVPAERLQKGFCMGERTTRWGRSTRADLRIHSLSFHRFSFRIYIFP